MSLLGFDAVGRLAVGQVPRKALVPIILVVSPSSFAVAANAVSFKASDNISPAAYVIAPQGVTLKELEAVSSNSFAVTSGPVSLRLAGSIASASYSVAASGTKFSFYEPVAAVSYALTPTPTALFRTGADFDLVYGGIGHYREEFERAKSLQKITRKTPAPIDRTTRPQFRPIGAAPSAPIAPAVPLATAENQRMAEHAAAVRMAKRRRDEEALLLLAS